MFISSITHLHILTEFIPKNHFTAKQHSYTLDNNLRENAIRNLDKYSLGKVKYTAFNNLERNFKRICGFVHIGCGLIDFNVGA